MDLSPPIRTGEHRPRPYPPPWPWAALLLLVPFSLLLVVCGSSCQDGRGKPQAATAGDSLALADTAKVAAREKKGGGFWARFGGNKQEGEEKEAPPVPVELVAVITRDLSDRFSTTATLEADKEARIVAKATGQVVRILVEEGDVVREGEELLQLDDSESRVRVDQATVKATNARREFERMAAMWEKGHASDREMADVRYQHEAAEAELALARLELSYARVTAPFAGVITERLIDPGETALVGTPLVAVSDRDPLLARVHMPERQVSRIAVGQEAVILLDAAPGEVIRGQVTMIAPRVDPQTGTVKVTVELTQPPAAARPGSFVHVHIVTDTHPGALAIPKRALVREAGEDVVFRAEADSVVKVAVTTGYDDGDLIEIASGLAAGDRVVRVGQGALRPGSRISAVTASADTGIAAAGTADEPGASEVESTSADAASASN